MATTGQTINDRLNAARYALAGRGLARTVCKATTEEVLGPKKKHIDYLLACTNEPNVSVPQLANLLIERTQHTSWAVVFKALTTIHSLMSQGNERFAQYLATSNHSFELADFMDRTTPQGYSMSTFVRRYSKYINYKTSSYRQLAMDLCKIRTGNDNALRTMNMDNLSKTLPIVQNQFDCLLEFSAEAKDLNNGVIMAAFRLLYKDLVRLYVAYQEAIINLLERYFKLSRKKTREALEMYKQYLATMDKVADFLRIVDAVGLDKSDMPDLTKSPGSILKILEQHLGQLEAKKRGTTPVSPGADEEGGKEEDANNNKENEPEPAATAEKVEPEAAAKQSASEEAAAAAAARKEPAAEVAKPADGGGAAVEKPPPPQKPARPSPKASPKVSPTSGAPPAPRAPPAPKASPGPQAAAASSSAPEKKGPPERPAKPPSRPPPPAASAPAPAPATSQPTAAAGPPAHPPPPKTASSPTPPHPPPPQPGHHQRPTTHQAHENSEQAAPAPPAPIEANSSERAIAAEEPQATNSNGQQATTDAMDADTSVTTNGQASSSEGQASSLPPPPPPTASTCSTSTADTQEVEQVREPEPVAGEVGTNHVNETDGHSEAAASNEMPPAAEVAAAAAEQVEELELPPPPPPIEDAELEDIEQQADQPDVRQGNEAAAPVENGQPDNNDNNSNININNESHADEQQ